MPAPSAPHRKAGDWTLPLVFERNEGQLPIDVAFAGKTRDYTVSLTAKQMRFNFPGTTAASPLTITFVGSEGASPTAISEAPFRTNYYIGANPTRYRIGIRNYSRVGLQHLYSGVDAEFYASNQAIEHDFIVAPGGDTDQIDLRLKARDKPRLNPLGDVLVPARQGELCLRKPVAYQLGEHGERTEVAAAYVLTSEGHFRDLRFRLGDYDHTRTLVIDPVIVYSSYLGGTAGSTASAIASDASGNVYVTGSTTSPASDFGVTNTTYDVTGSAPATAVFVARFSASDLGSKVTWLTYIGSTSALSQSTTVALQGGTGTSLFVGGSTAALDFPVTAGAFQATAAVPETRGFIASLAQGSGALQQATFVDSGTSATPANTFVRALAVDSNGNPVAVGAAVGSSLPLSLDAIAVNAAALASSVNKGFILKLNPALATEAFATYLMGDLLADTFISSVAADAQNNIYVGGYTLGDFPQAGPYSSGTMFPHNVADPGFDSFAAQILPADTTPTATIGYSAWLSGSSPDLLNSIALDPSGNLFLFGQTNSTDLITHTTYTYAGNPAVTVPSPGQIGSATPVSGTFPIKIASATTSGFAVKLDPTGQPLVVTYLGGTGNDLVTSGGTDTAGLVYAAGTSGSAQGMSYPSATLLPTGQDTSVANVQHGFLLQLPSALSAVNYIANLGGSSGTDDAVGVALDGSRNAYVAANLGPNDAAYTSYTAFQKSSHATNSSSSTYIAQISNSPTSGQLTLTPAATGNPDPIGFVTGQPQGITYTWTLTSAASTPPANLVIQIPIQTYVQYNSIKITDTTMQADLPASTCSVTTSGASCILLAFPSAVAGTNDSLSIVLGAALTTQPPGLTLPVTATVFDAASDVVTGTITSNVQVPAQLSIVATTSSPASNTVFSTSTGALLASTQVSYAFTISNAVGAGPATAASFTVQSSTGPGAFHLASVSAVPSAGASVGACDLLAGSGCASLNLPAGTSVVYTLTGTYPDAALNGGASATASGSFNASAGAFRSNPTYTFTPTTTIQRGVHLSLTSSLTALPPGASAFNLADPITYTVSVANNGPSASSGTDILAVTLPTGFSASSITGATCTAQFATCAIPAIAAGATGTITVTGTFPDNAGNSNILAAAVPESFSATATLNGDFESGTAGSSYSTSASTTVHRTANLIVITDSLTAPASVCAGGSATCVYMQNPANTLDTVPYSFTVQNAGPNISVGARIVITLPSAPAVPVGTPHPLVSGNITGGGASPAFGTALACTYAAATNQIVCGGLPMSNLPVATTALSAAGSLTVDSASVPTTAAFVTTASSLGSVTVTENANGAPASPTALPQVEIDRAAHLVTGKSVALSGTHPASPLNLDENKPSLTPGVNDTFIVTVQVGNTPLNSAPSVSVTEPLPLWFRMTQVPPAAANCTIGGVPLTANYATQGTTVVMTCAIGTVTTGNATPSSGSTPAGVGTIFQSFTYAGKFQDNGVSPDITGTATAKVKQLVVSLSGAAATTSVAVDPISPPDNTSAQLTVSVIRASHLLLRKTRNSAVSAAPSTFADTTDPNLDEKVSASRFGVNDEIEYDLALANSGPNQAIGVQFTDTLPPYFTLVNTFLISGASLTPDSGANALPGGQLAAGSLTCYAGAAVTSTTLQIPFSTGPTSQQITCTYGSPSTPLSLLSGPSHTGTFDNATSVEFLYQGKFQDNAPAVDDIPAAVNSFGVVSNAGNASATSPLIVDNGPPSDSLSTAFNYAVQRAAHLMIFRAPVATRPDGTPLTTDTTGASIVGEAEPSAAGGTPVFNCFRYKLYIQNIGPNISRQPQITFNSPTGLFLTSAPTGTTTTPGAENALPTACSYGASTSATLTGAVAVPLSELPNSTVILDADSYFGLNTLTASNSQAGVLASYTALLDSGIKDSLKTMAFTAVNTPPVTVANTPSGSNFLVSPFTASLSRPATITFGAITAPGVTSEAVSPAGPALPSGKSPDPRYGVIPLYRTGSGAPNFYTLGTTAVPAPGANPTGLCFSNPTTGAALSDTFFKPERTLLWALAGLPAGTLLNPVPNVSAPYTGDITLSLTQLGAASYVEAGGPALPYTAFSNFPGPQAQPTQICGQLNGFAPATVPVTLAALEPVNFSPVISPNAAQASQTPGKGVSEVSFLFPNTTDFHDFNDNDPCYVANSTAGSPTRQRCDDNLVLTTWIFGGENLVPGQTHVIGPLAPPMAQAFLNSPTPFEVQAGASFFELVADQLAVPIYAAKLFCDPGLASGSYTPIATVPACPASAAALAGNPPQEVVFGSAEIAQLTPSLNGGGSGLIVLPPAATPSSPSTLVGSGYAAAAATVTAGQTVGFQWNLLGIIPPSGGTYSLSCFMVDSATQTIVTPFPLGLTCKIPSSITFPANPTSANSPPNPAIYVVTTGTINAQNRRPLWKSIGGGILAALLLPVLLLRRRGIYSNPLALLVSLLTVSALATLSGCGSASTLQTPTAPATYFFRASATPSTGSAVLYTAPFSVKVVSGN